MDAAPTAARRLGRWLDWCVEHFGAGYFLVLAVVAVGSVAVGIVLAVASGSWAFLLVALAFPAVWLYMWWTG